MPLGDVHPNPYNHTRLTCICKQLPLQFSPLQEMAGKHGISAVRPADHLLPRRTLRKVFLSLPAYFSSRQAKCPRCAITALVNLFDRRLHFFHHTLRKGCVTELVRHLLTVSYHPVQKIGDDLPFLGILGRRRNQQPREAGDRIRRLARCVRDRNSKIGGHRFRRCTA